MSRKHSHFRRSQVMERQAPPARRIADARGKYAGRALRCKGFNYLCLLLLRPSPGSTHSPHCRPSRFRRQRRYPCLSSYPPRKMPTDRVRSFTVDLTPRRHHGFAILLFILGTLLPPLGTFLHHPFVFKRLKNGAGMQLSPRGLALGWISG